MKTKIATSLILIVGLLATMVGFAPATNADTYSQWCVKTSQNSPFYGYAAETPDEYAYLESLPDEWVKPFVNTAQGCSVYNDPETADPCGETIRYYLQVIGNFQDELKFVQDQRDDWQEAHDRVAASAVERNWEYAAEIEKNRKLTDKLIWKQHRLDYWRALAKSRR